MICTGALTNVALLVSLYPEVIPRLEVVLMGGAMGIGNTGPVMEFNIQVSPARTNMCADKAVMSKQLPVDTVDNTVSLSVSQ